MPAPGTTAPANSTWGKQSIGRASAACAALETADDASRPRASAATDSAKSVTNSDVYTPQPAAGGRAGTCGAPRGRARTPLSTGARTPILAAADPPQTR